MVKHRTLIYLSTTFLSYWFWVVNKWPMSHSFSISTKDESFLTKRVFTLFVCKIKSHHSTIGFIESLIDTCPDGFEMIFSIQLLIWISSVYKEKKPFSQN
jgi:hypothetical protein